MAHVAVGSRNTRFQAARYDLTWAGLSPADRASLLAPSSMRATSYLLAKQAAQPAFDPNATWGMLTFSDGKQVALKGERALVGRYDHDIGGIQPEVDLSNAQGSDTVSRIHASLEHVGSTFTLTDLNSTNSTRLNGKRLEPDKPTPINDGDTIVFGKVTCTFKKM